jgi:glucose-6-phosphate 1-epimerase
MADVPDDGWQDFFCVETSNAGLDEVLLAAGAAHSLGHTLSIISQASPYGTSASCYQ